MAHLLDGLTPSLLVGHVEDEQVVLGGGSPSSVAFGVGELEVVRTTLAAEHDAVEALMVFEPPEQIQPEPVPIEGEQGVQVIASMSPAGSTSRAVQSGRERTLCATTPYYPT